MPIERADRAGNYLRMSNDIVNDPGISLKAKGILAYLLSKPDHWDVCIEDIIRRSTDGRDSVRAGLNELIKAGYVKRTRRIDLQGRIVKWALIVIENPARRCPQTDCPQMAYPDVVKPDVAYPDVENPELVILNYSNTDISNTEDSKTEDTGRGGGAGAPVSQKKKFVKPTREEVNKYITESGCHLVDADALYDYYESNGWKVGRSPMKDWKATVRQWNAREKARQQKWSKPHSPEPKHSNLPTID